MTLYDELVDAARKLEAPSSVVMSSLVLLRRALAASADLTASSEGARARILVLTVLFISLKADDVRIPVDSMCRRLGESSPNDTAAAIVARELDVLELIQFRVHVANPLRVLRGIPSPPSETDALTAAIALYSSVEAAADRLVDMDTGKAAELILGHVLSETK